MNNLELLLRVAGTGLLLLCFLHIPIGRSLKWREDGRKLSPVNEQIFHVHTFFICVVIFLMALPCLFEPSVFLEKSRAGFWLSASLSVFWMVRLFFQFFVYRTDLWRGKPLETFVHWWFALIWLALAAVFGAAAFVQLDWTR